MPAWDTLLRNVHLATMTEGGAPYGAIAKGALAVQDGRIAWPEGRAGAHAVRFPLRWRGRTIGELVVDRDTPFSDDDRQLLDAIANQAQWFEDRMPILDRHKKANVTGITGKVITVVIEAGDAAPTTPVGINLPNADWIRKEHGSKSVSQFEQFWSFSRHREHGWVLDEIQQGTEGQYHMGKIVNDDQGEPNYGEQGVHERPPVPS